MRFLLAHYPFKSGTEHLFASMAQLVQHLFRKQAHRCKIRHTGSSPVTGVIAYWDKRLVHRALTPEVAVRSRNRPFLPWWLNWYSSRLLICHLGIKSGFGVQVPATALKHLNKFSDLSLQQIGKICCNFFVYFIDKCVHMCFNDIKHRQS